MPDEDFEATFVVEPAYEVTLTYDEVFDVQCSVEGAWGTFLELEHAG